MAIIFNFEKEDCTTFIIDLFVFFITTPLADMSSVVMGSGIRSESV